MKKLLITLTLLALLGFLSGCAWLEEPAPDYRALLIDCALRADTERGRELARERDTYRETSGSAEPQIDFDELLLLSRYLTLRAGDERISDEQRLCTGEVMLNRVALPGYPDSLEEVLAGEGELPERPVHRCAEAAWELLSGRRLLDSRAVLQSEGSPAGPVCATFCDRYYRVTYFCLDRNSDSGGAS